VEVANTLEYDNIATITAVKSFRVQTAAGMVFLQVVLYNVVNLK